MTVMVAVTMAAGLKSGVVMSGLGVETETRDEDRDGDGDSDDDEDEDAGEDANEEDAVLDRDADAVMAVRRHSFPMGVALQIAKATGRAILRWVKVQLDTVRNEK